jgi:hypothetical protein
MQPNTHMRVSSKASLGASGEEGKQLSSHASSAQNKRLNESGVAR